MGVLEQSWELPTTTRDGRTLSDTVRRLLGLEGTEKSPLRLALEDSTPRRAHPWLGRTQPPTTAPELSGEGVDSPTGYDV